MIKSELIARLANENPHLTQKDVERVVGVIFDKMTEALVDGGTGGTARLRRILRARPPRPRWPQSPHRRKRLRPRQGRALLQVGQGIARTAERGRGRLGATYGSRFALLDSSSGCVPLFRRTPPIRDLASRPIPRALYFPAFPAKSRPIGYFLSLIYIAGLVGITGYGMLNLTFHLKV